ncbi:hypothetical protein [Ferruginibacter sp. SUN106]|uniref:hypothetical protein n=1 Tax=Ferruginibacter sp. SUN106 TaxID=2978348 RepID=UPI003D36FF44
MKRTMIRKMAAVVLLIYSCSSTKIKKSESAAIRAVKISHNFPFIDKNGKLLRYDTGSNVNVYYLRDQVLYRDFYSWDSYVNDTLIKSEIRESFFVYSKGKTYGYFYDKNKAEFDRRLLIDSMLKEQWYNQSGFSNVAFFKVSEQYNSGLGTLDKTYLTTGKVDTTMRGTTTFFYTSHLNWVDYNLVKKSDTINKMKLCKVRSVTYGRYMKEYNMTLDTIVQLSEMKEIPVINPQEILYYFDREKKYNSGK